MKISTLSLEGFKTIKRLENLQFENINLFIGANGSGKSNLIPFFEMMSGIMTDAFQKYIADFCFGNERSDFPKQLTLNHGFYLRMTRIKAKLLVSGNRPAHSRNN